MTDPAQACGNCKWWKQNDTYTHFGDCEWNDGVVPEWAINPMGDDGNATTRESGKDCPTWHAK